MWRKVAFKLTQFVADSYSRTWISHW